MKKLLLLLLLSLNAVAQRTLPYPIILIHGFNGNGKAYWGDFTGYLRSTAGLTIEPNTLDYDLNADRRSDSSNKEFDVAGIPPYTIGNNDVYAINFDTGTLSNQAGVVKQGYALKFAIQRVLDATKANKVVLLGHSMGGLAAREYLQNESNWQSDGRHHLAKLITLGTPHAGSDLGTDGFNPGSYDLFQLFGIVYDQASEAVRDLRRSYKTNYNGVYLYGGYESPQYIQRGMFGGSYYNLDINCNGQIGDGIIGLNQKSISTDLAYACIIGKGVQGVFGDSDGVVLTSSQTFSVTNTTIEVFDHQCASLFCHGREPKEALLPMMRGLDEPETSALAYEINVSSSDIRRGFFTVTASGNALDTDRYKFSVAQSGIVTIAANGYQNDLHSVYVTNSDGDYLALLEGPQINATVRVPAAGTYYMDFKGNSRATWTSYVYTTSFCPLPNPPTVLANGASTLCEGEQLTLSTPASLANYAWYRDGTNVGENKNSLTVSQSGNYAVRTSACGVSVASANSVLVKVNPVPAKPVISIQDQPFGLLATNATNYQWYQDGKRIENATGPVFSAVSAGAYTVGTTVAGCFSESLPFVVTGLESLEESVKVYPNPSNGHFVVDLPQKAGAHMALIDVAGREIYQQSDKAPTTRKTVDARSVAPGAYLLRVKYNQRDLSRKIVIE